MGVNINRNRSIGRPSDWTVFLVVLGFITLGSVLGVWIARPRIVPPTFGTAGGIAIISLSLIAILAAAYFRRRAKWLRRTVGAVTLLLAVAAEMLAVGHLASGAPGDQMGWALSAGAVAMATLAFGDFGVPD